MGRPKKGQKGVKKFCAGGLFFGCAGAPPERRAPLQGANPARHLAWHPPPRGKKPNLCRACRAALLPPLALAPQARNFFWCIS